MARRVKTDMESPGPGGFKRTWGAQWCLQVLKTLWEDWEYSGKTVGIGWKFCGNTRGIQCEYCGNTMGISWECRWNDEYGILGEHRGNTIRTSSEYYYSLIYKSMGIAQEHHRSTIAIPQENHRRSIGTLGKYGCNTMIILWEERCGNTTVCL